MTAFALPKSIQKVLVVGPINNKLDKLNEVEKLLPEFDQVVINGIFALSDYSNSITQQTITRLNQLLATGKVVCNMSGADLLFGSKLDPLDPIEKWIHDRPNVVLIDFGGSFQCIVVSGGVPSHIVSLDQMMDNVEVSFAPHPHETYSGGLGYVISNTPVTRWAPKFYRYSAQIGNSTEGQVYAFKMDRNGIKRTILL
jgi:hypothetical protein